MRRQFDEDDPSSRMILEEVLKQVEEKTRRIILDNVPAEELRKRLFVKERLEGLSVEDRLKGLSPDELLAALSPEMRAALAQRLKDNGSSSPAGSKGVP